MTGGQGLEGKVAIITGGASGIGAGMARRFADMGATCVIVDLQEQAGNALARELGGNVIAKAVDVSNQDQFAAVIEDTAARFGRLDIMVNNAGIQGVTGSVTEISVDEWERTFAILMRSVFLGTKHAARIMKLARSGVILNTASVAGAVAGLAPHAYTAAKHAVVGFTKSTAVELSSYGIRVNAIAPGRVITPLTTERVGGDVDSAIAIEKSSSLFGRSPLPADIASIAAYLASDESWYINGECIVVDGAKSVLHSAARGVFYDLGD